MAEKRMCPECGASLAPDAPMGLCQACLLTSAMEPEQQQSSATQPSQLPAMTLHLPVTENPGDQISRYKLLQKIADGGMGSVWMADQLEPVRRRVALKVIKLGMDTKEVIGRFEAERQALALMDHPNIAKVLDAGATDSGRPFFVMELVKGIPITRYCDENKLDTHQRLNLFIQVCQAIQHAHQKGVIHRDIKPSNILVADHDGVPVPKIIDFGIAKATTGQPLTDKTVFTAFEQFIGTPAYMSPEQAKLSGLDIDTRSDVYSLGVLLYELLTGQTPFDRKRLVDAGLDEIRRIIREEDPPRPSTRLSTLEAKEQTDVARQRQSEPPRLLGLVRGDLDWIVMKCLEKDRNRRYETANGLALDVRHFLGSEPVTASPPSSLYRFHKLVRRNKLAFGAGTAVLLSLAIGVLALAFLLAQERRSSRTEARLRLEAENARQREMTQRQEAEAEATRARAAATETRVAQALTNPSLEKLFVSGDESSDVMNARRRVERANLILEHVRQASMLQEHGNLTQSEAVFHEALADAARLWSGDPARSEASICILADELQSHGRYSEVEMLFGQVLDSPGLKSRDAAEFVRWRARFRARRGQWQGAAQDFIQVIELDPVEIDNWWVLARIYAHLRDKARYAQHCQSMLTRFDAISSPAEAERTAKACSLMPLLKESRDAVTKLADKGLMDEDTQYQQNASFYEIAKGLSEFRQGRFVQAAKWMEKARDRAQRGEYARAQALFGLSMAQSKIGQTNEARVSFANGMEAAGTELSRIDRGEPGVGWYNLLGTHILMAEARTLLESDSAAVGR